MPETIETIAIKRAKWVEANRENNFDAGIKRLLTDLYPDNAHFVYELLQNAEDARAQEVRFILQEDRVEFEHDGERLFSITDVDAISSIGFSNKRDDATNIGKFGVGFKAVFAYTEAPEIESGAFHFRIRDMVVPTLDGLPKRQSTRKQTRFVLPFNNPKKPPVQACSEIQRLLKALDATTLLFLTHIRKIEYLLPDSSLGFIDRIDRGENRFEIRVQQPSERTPSSTWFLKFDKHVQVEDEEADRQEQKVKSCRIAVAFGLSPVEAKADGKEKKGARTDATAQWELAPLKPGRVCIYFPADKETSNLRFHLHAPFASTVARDSVRDCAGNNMLRDHLAELLAESMSAIRDQGLLTVRALAVLPNERDSLHDFYTPLMERLVEVFQEEDLVPMKCGGHAVASGIFRGGRNLSDLLHDEDMAKLLGDDYYPPMWVANPPQRNQREEAFLSMLEIQEWTDSDFVSALNSLEDEDRSDWMIRKSSTWHQKCYELLLEYIASGPSWKEEERKQYIADIPLVRVSDATYRKGKECFFPSDEVEQDDRFPRVAKEVYLLGDKENPKTRQFLEAVGVREVDEQLEIVLLLKQRYSEEAVNANAFNPDLRDMRRFVKFASAHAEACSIFENCYIFKCKGGDWVTSQHIYLDAPYMDTGVAVYYMSQGKRATKQPLSSEYEKLKIDRKAFAKFAERIGATQRLSRLDLEGLLDIILSVSSQKRALQLCRLLWSTLVNLGNENPEVLQSVYTYHKGWGHYGEEYTPSWLCRRLVSTRWVPQKIHKQFELVRPCNAVAEKLPGGFDYQTGWKWLRDISFGESVKAREEAKQQERLHQTELYKQKKAILKDVGFDSPEEAEEMARLKKADPEGFQRWRNSRQAKPAFPERASANPERRRRKAVEKAASAPDKLYEKRERSIRTSRTQGKSEVEVYLRDLYTDNDQLICQICHDEMPFRKKNGKHYFEKVEAFDLPKDLDANHLALCPVCAAKYDEFVCNGSKDERGRLQQTFVDMGDALELPVTLGEETATIRFVQNHAIDLRTAVESALGLDAEEP